jgi:hypothetical protein
VRSERSLLASGDTYAVIETVDDGFSVTVRLGTDVEPVAKLRFPQRPETMRATPDHVVFTMAYGRVVVLSVRDRAIVANIRTSLT